MALQFKKPSNPTPPTNINQNNNNYDPRFRFEPTTIRIPGLPHGLPFGATLEHNAVLPVRQNYTPPPLAMPGADLPRALNYYADYHGCGWWRMIMPEIALNINQKAIINGLTSMCGDPNFYFQNLKAVKLQRQATPMQLKFVEFLKAHSHHFGFKVIYEVDDIIFKDDIPLFNRCRDAFDNPDILESSKAMMSMADEITVTCQFMKDYYINKTGNKNITVIPNYPLKMWFDGFYNRDQLERKYDKYKNKPRIGYFGSGTHFDVVNRTNQQDDFSHVIQNIIKSRKDFTWVFIGSYPLSVKPFIDNGEMEYIGWSQLLQYPKSFVDANVNAVYAPLMDCTFNKAKSNIKFLEAACIGIPGIFQDLITYKDALLKFTSGNDLIDQLKYLTSSKDVYMKFSTKSRQYAETMWLDDHTDEHVEAYFTKIGDSKRIKLLDLNPDQRKV